MIINLSRVITECSAHDISDEHIVEMVKKDMAEEVANYIVDNCLLEINVIPCEREGSTFIKVNATIDTLNFDYRRRREHGQD